MSEFHVRGRREKGKPEPIDVESGMDDSVNEDCLYLNVWVPENASNAPVLVWIYGGAFIFGSTSQAMYDGARLANESGCIVVSISYRVGPLGWLGSRQLAKNEADGNLGTGNYGIWDVISGLLWIQENIGAFGGDPGNVTAFGESAGSIILHYLLVSPATPPNLFARACLESGTVFTVAPRTLPSAQAAFDALATKFGASPETSDEQKIRLLYDASPSQLLEAVCQLPMRRPRTEYIVDESKGRPARRMDKDQNDIVMDALGMFGPVWDGIVADKDFILRAANGLPNDPKSLKNAQKGILLGCTADEGSLFSFTMGTPQAMKQNLQGFHPHILPQVEKLYGTASVQSNEAAFYTASAYSGDSLFVAPVLQLMASLAQYQQSQEHAPPIYGYLHTHRPSRSLIAGYAPESSVGMVKQAGSIHTAEIPFLFGFDGTETHTFARETYPGSTPISQHFAGFTSEERLLSLRWMRSLAAFAYGKAPWLSVTQGNFSHPHATPADLVASLSVMTFDNMPRLGALSESAKRIVTADESGNKKIEVQQKLISQTLLWTEPVGSINEAQVASAHDKHNFWVQNGFKNLLISYYGDERIQFIP